MTPKVTVTTCGSRERYIYHEYSRYPCPNHPVNKPKKQPTLPLIYKKNARKKSINHIKELLSSGGLVKRKRSEAEIWLHNAGIGEEVLGLLVGDSWVDNNIIAWYPVDWGGDAKINPC